MQDRYEDLSEKCKGAVANFTEMESEVKQGYCNIYDAMHIMMYCIVFYYIVFYCIVFYCIAMHCIVLYCIELYCIVLYCIVL